MAAGGRSIKGCFDVALDWHVWVQTGGRRRRRPAAPRLPETGELCLEGAARRRRAHDGGTRHLEDKDLVSLDGVQVIVQGQEDLREVAERLERRGRRSRGVGGYRTRKDPNMAMEERKCQISWSSKKESRMQSRLCSRDSAGVF